MNTKRLIYLIVLVCMSLAVLADDGTTSLGSQMPVDLSQIKMPKPHLMLDEPVAAYDTATSALVFYFDTSCYSEYTITLSSDYASLDYYVTTPVVTIPAYMLGDVTGIYIDSDECGAYEAAFDLNEYTSGYME